ncbi:sulfatase-like hydrolase/transferase [Paracrocinitomix mangrovi]|uniref:LTA synthase family protein n=1 Tax=Paracrocinitomix mangrovi TaxID=2862509 RepID=UPI001C8D1C14|nr:LTA synthase family protein [Paracrocinitomix mangrovi]UKN02761.1 sulfatase-like hydrolase/transferase [Paracrocinitomix mangrovi]
MNNILPKYLRKLLLKMGIFMLIFSLCRLLFYLYNKESFPNVGFSDFLAGMWFDLITTSFLFYPIILIELFPNKDRTKKWFRRTTLLTTSIIISLGMFFNLVDIVYYPFSMARSNSSLFTMLGFGNDLRDQIPSYIADFWWLILLYVGLMFASFYGFKKIGQIEDDSAQIKPWKQWTIYILSALMVVFISRGGWVYKPIRPTEASKYTSTENVQLILNSTYTMISSIGQLNLEEKSYFSEEEVAIMIPTVHKEKGVGRYKDQNVMIIILESFSIEYISSLNKTGKSNATFFDQMVDSSLVFDWAFANGKKSIDAVPSILASIPKFMNDEYLLTPYSTNNLHGLPKIFNELGYETSFYHGASNGSMNFDAFCYLLGFQNYVGRNEFNNDEHYDGTWGIFDHEFLPWTAKKIDDVDKPFFATVFTISSHPPYTLPDEFENSFPNATTPMEKCIEYADSSLHIFFNEARKQPWFNNTLFVITADHTPSSEDYHYTHDRGRLHVPLMIYHPNDSILKGHISKTVGHIDIMPTVLDLIGYEQSYFAFGNSMLGNKGGYSVSNVAQKNYFMMDIDSNGYQLIKMGDEIMGLYAYADNNMSYNLLESKPEILSIINKKMKAFEQVYNHALIHNQTSIERQ